MMGHILQLGLWCCIYIIKYDNHISTLLVRNTEMAQGFNHLSSKKNNRLFCIKQIPRALLSLKRSQISSIRNIEILIRYNQAYWCAMLIVLAKHGGSCVHFSGISTCRRTSPESFSHPQCQPLPTPYKISLPVCDIVTKFGCNLW